MMLGDIIEMVVVFAPFALIALTSIGIAVGEKIIEKLKKCIDK